METLQRAYQRADQATMLRIVLEAGELREARQHDPNMHTNVHTQCSELDQQ